MKQLWEVVEGSRLIARNYISEVEGLKAVAYCENQVVELYIDSLEQAHDDAIGYTKRKFFNILNKSKQVTQNNVLEAEEE